MRDRQVVLLARSHTGRAPHGARAGHCRTSPSISANSFRAEVVDYFVDEYRRARTPNPCVRCNAALRFGALAAVADYLGLAWVATGHYARLTGGAPATDPGRRSRTKTSRTSSRRCRPRCWRGPASRWATYSQERDPCAGQEAAGLEVHDNPDSQEICFIPDDDYRRFLRSRIEPTPGEIVDVEGRVRGRHTAACTTSLLANDAGWASRTRNPCTSWRSGPRRTRWWWAAQSH